MGQIASAAVVCHSPVIMLPRPIREQMGGGADTSMVEGLAAVRRAIEEARADTLVIFDTHWISTVEHVVAGAAHFKGVYTSDELPTVIADHAYDYAGAAELAAAIARVARERRVCVLNATSPHLAPHYPTLNLVHHLRSNQRVLSVGVCQSAQPHNFLEMGAVIGEAIARTDARAVLLASGGMSHTFWPLDEIPRHRGWSAEHVRTREARAMDEQILELWRGGEHRAVIDLYADYRAHQPEGLFGHYLMAIGAIGGRECRARGRQMSDYESALGTGQVHMWFDL
jgi:3,4-dihydroxyphenylacetate 2,3-dioxygenase